MYIKMLHLYQINVKSFQIIYIQSAESLKEKWLLSLSSVTASGLTPPGKLFGYLVAARPVVAAINGPAKQIIEQARCGFVASDRDVDGLARIMQNIIDDPSGLYELRKNGRKYFLNNYTLEQYITKLEEHLKLIVGESDESISNKC